MMISYLVNSGNLAVLTPLVNVTAFGTVHTTGVMNVIAVRSFIDFILIINGLFHRFCFGVEYNFVSKVYLSILQLCGLFHKKFWV